MITYFFQLGREPQLSIAEIDAVFSLYRLSPRSREASDRYLVVTVDKELPIHTLMTRLGGTVSIAKQIQSTGSVTDTILTHLSRRQPDKKICFSLHGDAGTTVAKEIKKQLKANGNSARYIEPKNTATILHNNLVAIGGDLTVIKNSVYETVAIQPIADFTERDFGRPKSNPKSGMLPPKLAKIMINLAIVPETATLLDPFCGSGTLLAEAAVMGYNQLLGRDISKEAVRDTTENLAWIKTSYALTTSFDIAVSDVRHVQETVPLHSIDAIVTEPYLGQPQTGKESPLWMAKEMAALTDLFRAALSSFRQVLRPHGTVVMVVPVFEKNGKEYTIDMLSLLSKESGYRSLPLTNTSPTLTYHRESQHIARRLWRFTTL